MLALRRAAGGRARSRPARDGVADGDGGRRHDGGEGHAEDGAAAAAVRRGQPGAQLRMLMRGRAGCARRCACAQRSVELPSACVGTLLAREPWSMPGTAWRLSLWRLWAAAPCSCALVRDPCMGRWPCMDRDGHERARTRARGCWSGARHSGRRRVPPLCFCLYTFHLRFVGFTPAGGFVGFGDRFISGFVGFVPLTDLSTLTKFGTIGNGRPFHTASVVTKSLLTVTLVGRFHSSVL
jgi:hypothetical protein